MACKILVGSDDSREYAVFVDSVTETTFGPLMEDKAEAEEFMKYLTIDPRNYTTVQLIKLLDEFRSMKDG